MAERYGLPLSTAFHAVFVAIADGDDEKRRHQDQDAAEEKPYDGQEVTVSIMGVLKN